MSEATVNMGPTRYSPLDPEATPLSARLYLRIREGVFNEIATGEVHGHFPADTPAGAPGKTNWQIPTLEIAKLLAEALRDIIATSRETVIAAGKSDEQLQTEFDELLRSTLRSIEEVWING